MIFEVGLTQEKESALQLEASRFVSRNQGKQTKVSAWSKITVLSGQCLGRSTFFFCHLGIAVPRQLPQRTP